MEQIQLTASQQTVIDAIKDDSHRVIIVAGDRRVGKSTAVHQGIIENGALWLKFNHFSPDLDPITYRHYMGIWLDDFDVFIHSAKEYRRKLTQIVRAAHPTLRVVICIHTDFIGDPLLQLFQSSATWLTVRMHNNGK